MEEVQLEAVVFQSCLLWLHVKQDRHIGMDCWVLRFVFMLGQQYSLWNAGRCFFSLCNARSGK
jgi:hypothetical protein